MHRTSPLLAVAWRLAGDTLYLAVETMGGAGAMPVGREGKEG